MKRKNDLNRETVGKIVYDNILKDDQTRVNAYELQQGMQEDYIKNLIECTQAATKTYAGDFFVVVLTKREKVLVGVLRNYFLARESCPTPFYEQSVYRFEHATGDLHYVWTVPDQDTCVYLVKNALSVPSEEQQLLKFVIDFFDGSLLAKAKKYNGEEALTSIIQ
jgi:hypothetical protein